MAQTVMGIYVVKHPGAKAEVDPEDVGVILEGVQVLQELKDVPNACALLFGLIYVLNLSYPSNLRYTFEFIQKIIMELDEQRLSAKIQVLKNCMIECCTFALPWRLSVSSSMWFNCATVLLYFLFCCVYNSKLKLKCCLL